ncbi:MAG TPA: hypothetical protein VIK01_04185 [Polyangiaceae bacterium]
MRRRVVCAFLFLCMGCVGRGQDAHEPGDRLGTYHVTGPLMNDSCQAAVLGVTPTWAFDVKLSRQDDTLYWLNGEEAIPGTIAADGKSFDFESGVPVTLEAAQGVHPGCIIDRSDAGNGKLSSSTSDVKSFSINLSFAYTEQSGTQCAGFVGVEGGFASLPCTVSFAMTAERTALPVPE